MNERNLSTEVQQADALDDYESRLFGSALTLLACLVAGVLLLGAVLVWW